MMERENRLLYFEKCQEPSFRICGQLISPSGFLHHKRCIDENVLILITEGTLHISSNGRKHSISAGQYIILCASEEHYGFKNSEGRLTYLWAHFKTDLFKTDLMKKSKSKDVCSLPEIGKVSEYGKTTQLFHLLMGYSLGDSLYKHEMCDMMMRLILMELVREYKGSENNGELIPVAVLSARDWIQKHYYENITATQIAEIVGYDADYLSGMFSRYLGISISKYVNQLRIQTAKTLLSSYELTIKEAAYSSGFSDEKYFARVFKSMEGMTPSQYKKSCGHKNIN